MSKNLAIFWSIVATLLCTLIFSVVYFSNIEYISDPGFEINPARHWQIFVFAVCYALVHPLVGRLVSTIVGMFLKAIDFLYELKEGSKLNTLSPIQYMLVGACWPVTAPIALSIGTIAVVYGALYKSLFR